MAHHRVRRALADAGVEWREIFSCVAELRGRQPGRGVAILGNSRHPFTDVVQRVAPPPRGADARRQHDPARDDHERGIAVGMDKPPPRARSAPIRGSTAWPSCRRARPVHARRSSSGLKINKYMHEYGISNQNAREKVVAKKMRNGARTEAFSAQGKSEEAIMESRCLKYPLTH